MSEDGSEDVREAFALKSEVEGWKCGLCTNQIASKKYSSARACAAAAITVLGRILRWP